MDKCPKCHGEDINGPHYKAGGIYGECLVYQCEACKYLGKYATKDAEPKAVKRWWHFDKT